MKPFYHSILICLVSVVLAPNLSFGQSIESAEALPLENQTLIVLPDAIIESSESIDIELYDEFGLIPSSKIELGSGINSPFIVADYDSLSTASTVLAFATNAATGNILAIIPVDDPPTITHAGLPANVQDRLLNLCSNAVKNYGGNDLTKYKNITDPKLPEGGDYQEIYVTDKTGDGRRLVYDWNTKKIYYNNNHYKGTWKEITDPWWIEGSSPKFLPPK